MPHEEPEKPGWKHDRPPKDGLRGMGGHERFIFWKTSICYKDGNIQTAEALKKEKPAQAAAAKFFEHEPELLYSAASYSHHAENDHIPEIIVIGASNAGKSTFLNALLGGIEIAKVSSRPGKTTTMNAYGVGPRPKIAPELIRKGDAPPKHSLVLMDTPGYGHKSKASWGETIVQYITHRKMLRGAVILIPAEKDSYGMDKWMLRTLAHTLTPTLVVMTKADKCGEEWQNECLFLSQRLEYELGRLNSGKVKLRGYDPYKWRSGSDRTTSLYATAAGMDTTRRLGNGAGMGGVRLAILELAGYDIKGRVEQQPETKSYTGEIVSFDDIVWKA
ncbi:hypothetical protein CEP54_010479 [Fusarium duplospermum]|uniref:EngB-type G domain-containing protein n=1 Tax=Fusarium duplospermum TaxID=1325734 RepID=A0A428PJY9_9HYPO|nr:hypothetical protein CEP54_010479 [Fusarium duplospermum]